MLVVLIGNWSRFDVISLLAFSIIKHLWNSVRTVLLQGCGIELSLSSVILVFAGCVVTFHDQVLMYSLYCCGSYQIKSVQELSGQTCQICGDKIEITVDGEPFVACNECAFPVCRPCYEYERREGNQACPQCKTRYKRIRGEIVTAMYGLHWQPKMTYKCP